MTYFLVYATGARLTEKYMAEPARLQLNTVPALHFSYRVRPDRDYRDDIDSGG